jgi:transposase
MSMRPTLHDAVPTETARIAHAAFPKGHRYLALRDTLGPLYADAAFEELYAHQGPAGISPARLVVVTLLQYWEHLSDREAADAVRSRLDWKYLLGLSVDDPGFDASVLSEFRTRLQTDAVASQVLMQLLEHARRQGLLPERGRQRTDGTHVVAAVRRLNRLQLVQETMRHVLDVLALVAPTWLEQHADPAWAARYAGEFTRRRPKTETARDRLAETIGQDGAALLAAIEEPASPAVLGQLEAVQTLRHIWAQQYEEGTGGPHFRPVEHLAASAELTCSPYDHDARFSTRRETSWTGYLVHLTETCEPDMPHLVVDVETTPGTTPDTAVLAPIQERLAQHALLPGTQLTDGGYIDATAVVRSQEAHGITLLGPIQPDSSWQARTEGAFDHSHFLLDWEHRHATCPQGATSRSWRERTSTGGAPLVEIHFRQQDCQACPVRAHCTRASHRTLTVLSRPVHAARLRAQEAQRTPAFQTAYRQRAGIEGTISLGVRHLGMRRTRTCGLPRVHLDHLLLGASLTFGRLAAWFNDERPPPARRRPFQRLMAASASP